MSADVMKERITETSPQVYARIGGVLYLMIIVIGFCSEFFVRDKLVVSGDVTATANNIRASESLWRISVVGDLILLVCAVPLTLILYVLLRPVNKHLALLALFFNLVEFPATIIWFLLPYLQGFYWPDFARSNFHGLGVGTLPATSGGIII
jgi:Domain of unknown function (DUF4386)